MRGRRAVLAVLAAAGLVATACTGGGKGDDRARAHDPGDSGLQRIAMLTPFDACDDFLTWVKDEARARVEPWGLPGAGGPAYLDAARELAAPSAAGSAPSTALGAGAAAGAAGGGTTGVPPAPATTVASSSSAEPAMSAGALTPAPAGSPSFSATNPRNRASTSPTSSRPTGGAWSRWQAARSTCSTSLPARPASWARSISGPMPPTAPNCCWPATAPWCWPGRSAGVDVEWRQRGPLGERRGGQRRQQPGQRWSRLRGPLRRPERAGPGLGPADRDRPPRPHLTRGAEHAAGGGGLRRRPPGGHHRRVVLRSRRPSSRSSRRRAPARPTGPARPTRRSSTSRPPSSGCPPTCSTRAASGAGPGGACDRSAPPGDVRRLLPTVSVLSVDLAKGLTPGDAVFVLADGQQVYASADHLFVAVNRTDPGGSASGSTATTEPARCRRSGRRPRRGAADRAAPVPPIEPVTPPSRDDRHPRVLDPSDGPATYLASGQVRGHLLDDFAMSGARWGAAGGHHRGLAAAGRPGQGSESFVTTLGRQDGRLVPLGEVGGLGAVSRSTAVRFVGDVGYVVTFRQTDPLYTVDLADPAHPTGASWSSRVLGLPAPPRRRAAAGRRPGRHRRGPPHRSARWRCSTCPTSTQPKLVDKSCSGSWSDVEHDYHAFLWWAPAGSPRCQ